VVDVVEESALLAAEKYDCDAMFDHRDLIGKVDAVSIAVPTVSHHKIAKDFLESGVDVLLEKPMAATLKEADELVAISDEKGAILQIGFIERFNPAIVALERITDPPAFIESHRLHPFAPGERMLTSFWI
jgi:Predicted dehydrogenases and related proteins